MQVLSQVKNAYGWRDRTTKGIPELVEKPKSMTVVTDLGEEIAIVIEYQNGFNVYNKTGEGIELKYEGLFSMQEAQEIISNSNPMAKFEEL